MIIPEIKSGQPTLTGGIKKGIFVTADGNNLFVTFALVTSLFLLWGFCNGMIDILNKHFQDSLHINKEQSGLVQFANYLGYFLMAIPAGLIARKFGYKGGILFGLALIAAGAFWFIPATNIGQYWAFLLGLFVIAAGMTCLETIINVAMAAVCMGGGTLGLYAMFGSFFFMSVMYPTIFALGIQGLGDYTKLGASLIVMSIVGGAIAAPFMGHIADTHSMRIGFVVPLVCFVLIAIYGLAWEKLEAKDNVD
jgi:fucose permease